MRSLAGTRCEVLMSHPTVGRASLELMFGSWCRGRRTAVSTQVGGGPDVTLPRRGWEKAP